MVDYGGGVKPHKQMAGMTGDGGGGNFGVAPLSSHMGAQAEPHGTNHPALPDHQRAHKGHHRRSERAALDGHFDQGGADHGPLGLGGMGSSNK